MVVTKPEDTIDAPDTPQTDDKNGIMLLHWIDIFTINYQYFPNWNALFSGVY